MQAPRVDVSVVALDHAHSHWLLQPRSSLGLRGLHARSAVCNHVRDRVRKLVYWGGRGLGASRLIDARVALVVIFVDLNGITTFVLDLALTAGHVAVLSNVPVVAAVVALWPGGALLAPAVALLPAATSTAVVHPHTVDVHRHRRRSAAGSSSSGVRVCTQPRRPL